MIRVKPASTWTILGLGLLAAACSSTPDSPPASTTGTTSTTRQEGPGSLSTATTIQTTATVESIDYTTRVVGLRTEDNRLITITASDQVRNLAQVHTGDQVVATYIESVDIRVRRPGEATPGVSAAGLTTRAAVGAQPGASQVDSVMLTTKVAEIDRKAQTVVLESQDGKRRTVQVRNPAQFDHVAVGDLVEITLTQAVGISVERPTSR